MRKNRILYCVLLLFCLIFLVASNHRSVLLLCLLLLFFALFSFTLLFLGRNEITSVSLERKVGKENDNKGSELYLHVVRKHKFPIGKIRIRLFYENRLYGERNQWILCLNPQPERDMWYSLPWNERDCGYYVISFERILLYDLMGLMGITRKCSGEIQYPRYPSFYQFLLHATKNQKNLYDGEFYDPNKRGHDPSEVFDLRDYQEGDAINSIHWKLSGKLERLIVRESGNPITNETVILCDPGFESFRDNHKLVDGILCLFLSVSKALLDQGMKHKVYFPQKTSFLEREISTDGQLMDALLLFLQIPITDGKELFTQWRLQGGTARTILITGALRELEYQELAEKTALTVILLSEHSLEQIEERSNYKIVALPLDEIGQKVKQIDF